MELENIKPIFFKNPNAFREWLEKNHAKKSELWVGFYKVKTGKPSLTWSESVDQGLCFGWIDGIRKSLGPESYCIRFTPRRKNSNWSAVNIQKVKDLTSKGLMKESGKKAFELRKENKSNIYSYDSTSLALKPKYVKLIKENNKAWDYYHKQAPSYRKQIRHWIMSAKKEETRLSRLKKLIVESEHHRRVY
jgi:uncharacterized protein YdeI (YjbR/CyaY-like superfamily)